MSCTRMAADVEPSGKETRCPCESCTEIKQPRTPPRPVLKYAGRSASKRLRTPELPKFKSIARKKLAS